MSPLNFFFLNLFSLFLRRIQLGRKICPLESYKLYTIMLKCPLTPISSSAFINFKVILLMFDFLHDYVLLMKILRENQRK